MRVFECDRCGSLVFFENVQCVKCGLALGFLPEILDLSTLETGEYGHWKPLSPSAGESPRRLCANGIQHQACNWLVSADDDPPFCASCRLNQIIPDLSVPGNLERWRKIESAKRRILYSLLQLGLSTEGDPSGKRPPLRFSFLGDPPGGPPVLTGHRAGLVTLNIAEADDDERERRRVNLREPYRTLLGHMRHEVAHYYWDRLIADSPNLERFRKVFGDETLDYTAALQNHYQAGPPPDWQLRHVSAYAGAHPWEDWAESWSHYLHMVDTVETAASFGMTLQPEHPDAHAMSADPAGLHHSGRDFDGLLNYWLPLTYALNSINRGMGLPDLYPFVLSVPAIAKLQFIHEVIHGSGAQTPLKDAEPVKDTDPA